MPCATGWASQARAPLGNTKVPARFVQWRICAVACRCVLLCLSASIWLRADSPAFDLSGPKVDVHVKRGEATLPIGEVPNLLPGDRLWIHPDLPESQSAHYVLVVAFLRGATNPPPPEWFTRVETWNREARERGRLCQSFPQRRNRR